MRKLLTNTLLIVGHTSKKSYVCLSLLVYKASKVKLPVQFTLRISQPILNEIATILETREAIEGTEERWIEEFRANLESLKGPLLQLLKSLNLFR